MYQGQWWCGREHGQGVSVHWSPEGGVWVYIGEYRDGQRDGSGGLVARERGSLLGALRAGRLCRGVELLRTARGGLEVAVLGAAPCQDPAAASGEQEGGPADAGGDPQRAEGAATAVPDRVVLSGELGPRPQEWEAAHVRAWLRGLGLEDPPEKAPLSMSGAELLSLPETELEGLVCQCNLAPEVSELAQGWRSTLRAAHLALRRAVEEMEQPLSTWEELQAALPGLRKRVIPRAEITITRQGSEAASADAVRPVQSGEWRGMVVELFPLPLRLRLRAEAPVAAGGDAAAAGDTSRVPLAVACGWARDLELLAAERQANLRPLLGLTLSPVEGAPGLWSPTLVYEATRYGGLLFEWIHASLPDGGRRPLDFRTELRISEGTTCLTLPV